MQINLNQLRCFYMAARHKSMKKAAETMFVTPPAITMQIKKLEEWHGVRLLVKKGNNLTPTKEGSHLFEYAEKIFASVEKLEIELEKERRKRQAQITIGCHHIPGQYIMPKLMEQLRLILPGLKIKVVLDNVPRLMDRLRNQDLHFVLTASPPPCPKIKSIPLFTEDFVLVARTNSQHSEKTLVKKKNIKELPLLLPENDTVVFHIINEFLEENGILPCVVMKDLSADIVRNFILQDVGVAFLLRFTVQDKLESGELREIAVEDGVLEATFALSYFAEKSPSPEVQEIIASLKETTFERSQLV